MDDAEGAFADRTLVDSFEEQMASVRPDRSFEGVPLKRAAKYGVFLWWPQPGTEWIASEDVALAEELIPSNRIFRRDDLPDGWAQLSYGETRIRVRPTLWLEIKTDGFEVGDPVEVKSRGGREVPVVAKIADLRWDKKHRKILYRLKQGDQRLPKTYGAEQFRMVRSIEGHLSQRQLDMIEKDRFR